MVEQAFTHREAEAGGAFRREKAAADGKHGAAERDEQHIDADADNVAGDAAGRFDERSELRHIVWQTQLKPDLPNDQHCAEQRHKRFPLAHLFE